MDYMYKPPIERNSLLISLTEGCPYNKCRFCGTYKNTEFRVLSLPSVESYVKEHLVENSRVYFVGADPLCLSISNIDQRINLIKNYLSGVVEFTMYARVASVKAKSNEDLALLKSLGVNELYLGIECGLDDVLSYFRKGITTQDIKEQCARLKEAGIKHRDMIMFGAAGSGRYEESAKALAELENTTKPEMIITNNLSFISSAPIVDDVQEQKFKPAKLSEILLEAKTLIENLDISETYIWSAEPLGFINLRGNLVRDRAKLLDKISYGLEHAGSYDKCKEQIISFPSIKETLGE